MTTCEECGKFDQSKENIGNHWICKDCKVESKKNEQKKSGETDDSNY